MLQHATTIYVGDLVGLRKPHPSGSSEGEIVRVGADIGLLCQRCGRRVLLSRHDFTRGVKKFIRRGQLPPPTEPGD